MRLQRGEADSVALSAEHARRLWADKRNATLAERIGRESTSILDREELIAQLLGECPAGGAPRCDGGVSCGNERFIRAWAETETHTLQGLVL